MRNIKLMIAYDGTNYHGFQRQANALTIQEVLETKLSRLFNKKIKIAGAGRTDAKVHAYGQVVTFYAEGNIPTERIPLAAKGLLPADIVVLKAEDAAPDFHARFSAKSKIYCYKIYNEKLASPFWRNYAWHYPGELDVRLMNAALNLIIGEHDFSAFRAAGSTPSNPVKTIFKAYCEQKDAFLHLRFWGSGFLYHMVRNLVGTVTDVGNRRKTVDDFYHILVSGNRNLAGITAPPQGLYLEKVFY